MTGKDSLVWFCGGTGGTGGEPEFIWPHDARDSGIPHPDSEAARQGVIHGVQIICGDCGRLAPFVNGCRWIDTTEDEAGECVFAALIRDTETSGNSLLGVLSASAGAEKACETEYGEPLEWDRERDGAMAWARRYSFSQYAVVRCMVDEPLPVELT
jgi:hypothetical protein